MTELEKLQKHIGSAYAIMPADELYRVNEENTKLKTSLNNIKDACSDFQHSGTTGNQFKLIDLIRES